MISRYDSHERKFSNWYLDTHPMYQNNRKKVLIRQLGEVSDHNEMLKVFQRALLQLKEITPGKASRGVIYVDYGYSYAAVEGKDGLSFVSRQSAFKEIEYWKYDVTEQLGFSDDQDDIDPLASFVQWIDDPQDKLELFYDVFRKILKRIVTETLDRLGESVEKTILIMLPSLPAGTSADWEKVLSSITKEKCEIVIDNHGTGMELQQGTSLFLYHNYLLDAMETTLVEVFTQDENGHIHADSYFYDKGYETDTRRLLMVDRVIIHNDKIDGKMQNRTYGNEVASRIHPLPVRLGNVPGFIAFLRSHPAAFRDYLFVPVENASDLPSRIRQTIDLFEAHESLSVAYVCSQLCGEIELANISLMDMASTCGWLENKLYFRKTNLITHKKKIRFGVVDELPLNMDAIPYIPSNYSSIGWKCIAAPDAIPDYRTLDKNTIDIQHIVPVLQSIVTHYDYCTAEDAAADLYFILKGGQEEPSAILTAKVYLILAQDSSFIPRKISEIVHKPLVDNEFYEASMPVIQGKQVVRELPDISPVSNFHKYKSLTANSSKSAQNNSSTKPFTNPERDFAKHGSFNQANKNAELDKQRSSTKHGIKRKQTQQASQHNKHVNTSGTSYPNSTLKFAKAYTQANSVAKSIPTHKISKPATFQRFPNRVHSKTYGSGIIIEHIEAKSGNRVTVLFDSGLKKTFDEKLALQTGIITYDWTVKSSHCRTHPDN